MADSSIIRPPDHISRKVLKTGSLNPKDAILTAQNAAGELANEYQGWIINDWNDLLIKFQKFASMEDVSSCDVSEIFDITHEIKGQG